MPGRRTARASTSRKRDFEEFQSDFNLVDEEGEAGTRPASQQSSVSDEGYVIKTAGRYIRIYEARIRRLDLVLLAQQVNGIYMHLRSGLAPQLKRCGI